MKGLVKYIRESCIEQTLLFLMFIFNIKIYF